MKIPDPYRGAALYDDDFIILKNEEDDFSETNNMAVRIDRETGRVVWNSLLHPSAGVKDTRMNDACRAAPRNDSWRYQNSRYSPLFLRETIDEIQIASHLVVLDLSDGTVIPTGRPFLSRSHTPNMDQILQVGKLFHINLGEESTCLTFNGETGEFLSAITIMEIGSEASYLAFPRSYYIDIDRWIHSIHDGRLYLNCYSQAVIVDLVSKEILYGKSESIELLDRTEEILKKYGLD